MRFGMVSAAGRGARWRGRLRRAARTNAFTFCLVILTATTGAAAPGDLLFKLSAPDGDRHSGFGESLAIVDGDILVGELYRYEGPPGRAYLFDGQTGQLRLTFSNPAPGPQDHFGMAIGGGDGRVFISTSGLESRVDVFSSTSGQLLQAIYDPAAMRGGSFGTSLAYDSDLLLVGDPSYSVDLSTVGTGRAYLFNASSGELERTIFNPDPNRGDLFSFWQSLTLFGDKLAVGAIGDLGADGRVWVFDRESGQMEYAIANPRAERFPPLFQSDWFGKNVVANEEIIAVGVELEDTSGVDNSGAVYVFDSISGTLKHTLISPQPEVNGEFGQSLALTPDGDILVGAWGESANGLDSAGHAYLFDSITGGLLLDLSSPEPLLAGTFGGSVAAMDGALVIGAPNDGAVYVFEPIPEPSTLVLTGSLLISVLGGALHKTTDVDRVAGFTQRHNQLLDILALGARITAARAGGGQEIRSGTSIAAPHVAAAVAIAQQMKQAYQVGSNPFVSSEIDQLFAETADWQLDGNDGDGIADDEDDDVANSGFTFPRLNVEKMAYKLYKPDAPDLINTSDWGFAEVDNITADTTPTFVGTVPAGSFVQLYVGQGANPIEVANQQLAVGDSTYEIKVPAGHPTFALQGAHNVFIRVSESSGTLATHGSLFSNVLPITLNRSTLPATVPLDFDLRLSETLVVSGSTANGSSTLAVGWDITPLTLTKAGAGTIIVDDVTNRAVEVNYISNEGTTKFDVDLGISKNGAQARVAKWDVNVEKTTANPSSVEFNVTSNIDVLNVGTDAVAKVTHGAGQPKSVLILNALVLGPATGNAFGTLDLTDSGLVVDYAETLPTVDRNELEAKIRRWIVQGRGGVGIGNGHWNGKGITSSTAAAMNAMPSNAEARSVGYGVNVTMPLGPLATFMGQEVDETSVLVRYTVTGDMDLNGTVDNDDITIMSAVYPHSTENRWSYGDVDYDGDVDDDDVALVNVLYGQSVE